jgi:mediator of RNA polymerase II transcription subunit 6
MNISSILFRSNMTGLEYTLLHAQEPILYVVRKQHRTSPTQTVPVADFYIIAGVVYQAPDLISVINSRMVSLGCAVFH